MNLKHTIIFYPSMERGGATDDIQNIIKYLIKKNIKVSLVSNHIKNTNLKTKHKNFFFSKVSNKNIFFKFSNRWTTSFYAIKNLIANFSRFKKKNTVVLSMQSSMVSIIICKLFGVKVIARNQEDPIYSTIHSENVFFATIIFILRFFIYNFADGILTNSYGSKKSLEFFIFKKNKIKAIYNPYLLKIKKRNLCKKKNIILSIGRLRKQKDFQTLIKGFNEFLRKFPNYKLIILGDGPDKIKILKLISRLNLENKVILKGWVNNTEKYLSYCKVFALTSLYEGLGNVYIDAVNYEVPCVYTKCNSGPNEILLDDKGGYPIRVGNYNELNKSLVKCISNYAKSKKMILHAKKKIERFTFNKTCPDYLRYLEKISND